MRTGSLFRANEKPVLGGLAKNFTNIPSRVSRYADKHDYNLMRLSPPNFNVAF